MAISLQPARRKPDSIIWPSRTVVKESTMGPIVCSPADHILMVTNLETSDETKRELLEAAFQADPYSPSLFVALADLASSDKERVERLHEAVRLGYQAWKQYEEKRPVVWWNDVGTRPFLLSLKELALCYSRLNEDAALRECLSLLTKFDPSDHTGARAELDEHHQASVCRP